MSRIAVVDGLYPKTARLLVGRPERPITVSRECLPDAVQEGDIVRIAESAPKIRRLVKAFSEATDKQPDPAVLSVEPDPEETQRRRAVMRRLNAKLMGKDLSH